jgi:hypothetical protein
LSRSFSIMNHEQRDFRRRARGVVHIWLSDVLVLRRGHASLSVWLMCPKGNESPRILHHIRISTTEQALIAWLDRLTAWVSIKSYPRLIACFAIRRTSSRSLVKIQKRLQPCVQSSMYVRIMSAYRGFILPHSTITASPMFSGRFTFATLRTTPSPSGSQ